MEAKIQAGNQVDVWPDHLYVDLDGTLIRTDVFGESIIKFVKLNPLNLLRFAIWLTRGRAYAKDRVAQTVDLDIAHLPYESPLVDYLRAAKQQGRRLVLATASHRKYAVEVAEHVGLFDDVIGSDSGNNFKGRAKLAAIREQIGPGEFSYAGDSKADRPIWKKAAAVIMVNAPENDVLEAESRGKAELVIKRSHSLVRAFVKEMRPVHWTKNLLVFLPLLVSSRYLVPDIVLSTLLAFIMFSVCASGIYFINDLLDLDDDRRHDKKRLRPLASGDLPIQVGVVGAFVLPLIAFGAGWMILPVDFLTVLAVYFGLSTAYSFYLKQTPGVNFVTRTAFYALRIAAGAAASGIALSY